MGFILVPKCREVLNSEIEKKGKSYPTISNITIPKNTDMK